jgi:hypothetical protein
MLDTFLLNNSDNMVLEDFVEQSKKRDYGHIELIRNKKERKCEN